MYAIRFPPTTDSVMHSIFSRKVSGLVLSGAIIAVAIGCGKKGIPAPTGGSDIPPSKVNLKRGVELTKVEQRQIISHVESVGSIEAEFITQIPAGVVGIVDRVHFREGDLVDPADGKPLVEIDQLNYIALVEIAQEVVKENKSSAKIAEDELRRLTKLRNDGSRAVTEQEFAKAVETLASAQARYIGSEAALRIAKLNLERSRVLPPIKGQINQRLVTPRSRVKEETIIATIADMSRLRLSGYIPESSAALVRTRIKLRPQLAAARSLGVALSGTTDWNALSARLLVESGEVPSGFDPEFVVQALPNRMYRGGIFFMSTTGDPSTRMFEIKAEIDARSIGLLDLYPGYSAKIRIPVQTTNDAMIVPEEAVRATERGFIVFEPVLRTNRDGQSEWVARPRRVEVGVRSPGSVEIRSGLSPNQWIVRRGGEALEDGTPLRFSPEQEKALGSGK
jgi:membrane fusion protein, multidrug efflux system